MPDSGAGRIREQELPPGRQQPGSRRQTRERARARMLLHHHIDATGTDALAGVLIPDLVSHVNQRAPGNISSTMKRFRPRRAPRSLR
jgi:hypothetical protein